jgi:hypothetical protein
MDENLFLKLTDEIEGADGLTTEDNDLLKSLETMAAEVEDEADKPK